MNTSPISEPTTGLENAIDRVRGNIDRRAANGKQAERGHVPGARALERLEANAARQQAKRADETKETPQPIEPAPIPAPTPSPSPIDPISTSRFEITA